MHLTVCSFLKWSTQPIAAVAQHVALKATNLKMHGLEMGRMKALPTALCPFFLSVLPSVLVTCLLTFYILICSGMTF